MMTTSKRQDPNVPSPDPEAEADAAIRNLRYVSAAIIVITVVVIVGGVLFWHWHDNATHKGAKRDAQISALAAQQQQAKSLAQQITQACQSGQAGQLAGLGISCSEASHVATASPAPSVAGEGPKGATGRGITQADVVAGNLVLTYSDGTTSDVGVIVGPAGPSGSPGPKGSTGSSGPQGNQGEGIESASVNSSGHLLISYTDGSTADLGQVVGPSGANGSDGLPGAAGASGANGRGVTSVVIDSNGHLIVTYDDGTTQDAGTVPTGPACPSGYTLSTRPAPDLSGDTWAVCVAAAPTDTASPS